MNNNNPSCIAIDAIGENGDDASFAGQYETILKVEGLDADRGVLTKIENLEPAL